MTYAIIGSGAIGKAIATQFSRNAIPVLMANSRGRASIEPLVAQLGSAIVPSEVSDALEADMIVLAVPYEALPAIVEGVGDWKGRILIDATNAIDYTDFSPLDLGGEPSTNVVSKRVPGARVVKGFNHLWASVLGRPADDGRGYGRRVMFVSGNDPVANAAVAGLMMTLGFFPIDLGRTDAGGLLQQFGGPLTTHSFIDQEIGGASLPEMDLLHSWS